MKKADENMHMYVVMKRNIIEEWIKWELMIYYVIWLW